MRILDIRAAAARSARLGSGASVLHPGPQGLGESARIGLDLDSADLTARSIKDELDASVYDRDYFGARCFAGATVGLGRGEQQVFQVTARTLAYSVEWFLELVLLAAGREVVHRVGVGEHPLRTTALHPNRATGDRTAPDPDAYAEVCEVDFAALGANPARYIRFVRTR